MQRRQYQYVTVTGVKGINQQERLADPELELADARNLWAPNGRIEKRPGYYGVAAFTTTVTSAAATGGIVSEDTKGTYVATGVLGAKAVEKWWYVTATSISDSLTAPLIGIQILIELANTNNMTFVAEYWNGDTWAPLHAVERDATTFLPTQHLAGTLGTTPAFMFPWPTDITATSSPIAAVMGGAPIRFTLKPFNGSSAFSADTEVGADLGEILVISTAAVSAVVGTVPRYITVAKFPGTTRYLRAYTKLTFSSNIPTSLKGLFYNSGDIKGPIIEAEINDSTYGGGLDIEYNEAEPPSIAVVPQFEEFYVSYGGRITVHKARPIVSGDTAAIATVENDPEYVGDTQQYAPTYVPQTGFPEAKYIAYHRGELWAANLVDGSTSIRWSAASPAYRVWPQINVDVVADTDQGPITALFPFNQNMFVFKSDSIWQMVYTGLNDLKLNTYRAEKLIPGVGCVSNSSIQEINGKLVFLAEDGVYLFNGGQAVKISNHIQKTIDSIVPGRRPYAVSAHWKAKSLYLLAITTKGASLNDLVIVWDYKNDSWWLWDNIDAVNLFTVEDGSDAERLYFADHGLRVYELGVGYHDYGTAITAYGTTQRLGQAGVSRKARLIDANATNVSDSFTVETQANDAPFVSDTNSFDLTDDAEKTYGSATGGTVGVYGTSTYVGERDREDGAGVLISGDWFRMKVTHSAKNAPFQLNSLSLGMVPMGVRK